MSKIVLVDDVYAELQLIEGILKSANHTVVSYMSTDKLEGNLAIEKPDLIILDVSMRGRNGSQACRDLKNDEPVQEHPGRSLHVQRTGKRQVLWPAAGRECLHREAP
jgi:CheY-like chemotaxis protein